MLVEGDVSEDYIELDPFDPLSGLPPTDRPWGINFGGGANSTALVVESFNRGLKPDWILFADTGSERPETYESIRRLQLWLADRNWTPISVTCWERQEGVGEDGVKIETLEQYCLRTNYMPSAAYGYAGCSSKFKRNPAERWRKENGFEVTVYALGFDAGEKRRVNKRKCERAEGLREEPWYPLYAWGITREDCNKIIEKAGLPPVAKSACFFCPYTKQHEWEDLYSNHRDLFERAKAIEENAESHGNARTGGLRRGVGFLRELFVENPVSCSSSVPDTIACDCFEASE